MYNYKKKLKNQNYLKLKTLFSTNYYMLFYRYNNLTFEEMTNIKKSLNNQSIFFKIIKQKLIKKFLNFSFSNQGSLILIYFKTLNDLKIFNVLFKNNLKIQPLILINNNNQISILKINKIFKNKIHLSYKLKQNIFHFYKILVKMKNI